MRLPSAFRVFSTALVLVVLFAIAALSGAAGRMFGLADRSGGLGVSLMAVILVAAGAIFINKVGRTPRVKWGVVIAYLTFACGVAAYSAYDALPPYTLENIAIDVTVHDVEGRSGTIKTHVTLNFQKDGVQEILWGGLGSTGEIQNLTVGELSEGVTSEVTQENGMWQYKLHFAKPPEKGQRASFTFTFDVQGSKPEPQTYWEHYVRWPTRNLQITLHVHQQRPCKSVYAFSDDADKAGANRSDEHRPMLALDDTVLTWNQANPEQGRRYVVVCEQ